MRTITIFEKGDKVLVKGKNPYGLCTNNAQGGTESVKPGVAKTLTVTRTWVDPETGRRYVGEDKKGKEFYFGEFSVEVHPFLRG